METRKCPRCGHEVSWEEYYCLDCGEYLFNLDPSQGGWSVGTGTTPQLAPDSPQAGGPDTPQPVPGTTPDYGYAPLYLEQEEPPPASPSKRVKIPWDWIVFTMLCVAVLSVSVLLVLHYRKPRIKVSPPPGWHEANESERNQVKALYDRSPIKTEIDYVFSSDIDSSDNRIVIIHFDTDTSMESRDMDDMQREIEELEETGYITNPYQVGIMLEDARPVQLGCGLAGIYLEMNPENIGARETLIVGKKNRRYMVFVDRGVSYQTPSPEMQYLIDNIRLD